MHGGPGAALRVPHIICTFYGHIHGLKFLGSKGTVRQVPGFVPMKSVGWYLGFRQNALGSQKMELRLHIKQNKIVKVYL